MIWRTKEIRLREPNLQQYLLNRKWHEQEATCQCLMKKQKRNKSNKKGKEKRNKSNKKHRATLCKSSMWILMNLKNIICIFFWNEPAKRAVDYIKKEEQHPNWAQQTNKKGAPPIGFGHQHGHTSIQLLSSSTLQNHHSTQRREQNWSTTTAPTHKPTLLKLSKTSGVTTRQ